MEIAFLPRYLALHQVPRRLEVEHKNLRLEQRGLHPLAFAGALAVEQRHDNAVSEQQAGRGIVDRNPDPHRALTRQPGDRHQAAHALGDLVDAGSTRVRAILAEAGDATVDDTRIDLADRLVIDAE